MMKKNIYIVVFFTILTAYVVKAQNLPAMVTPYSDIIPSYEVNIDGVKFSVGVDEYRKKLFLQTNDKNFKLKGESVIGRTLSSFENKADIKLMQGWGYYLKLDEDWYAAFRLNEIGNDNSIVRFVFQYKI